MPGLLLGIAALLLLAMLLRWFASASIGQLRSALFWSVLVAGGAALALVALSGRGGQIVWVAVLFGPLIWRWWQGRRLAARFAAQPLSDGDVVRTATLEMRLDPTSGAWSGSVCRGPFSGLDLTALSLAELETLLRDCEAQDAESVPLVEAWLDRTHPGWRESHPGSPAEGPMTRQDALAVLGLKEGAGEDAIRAAYTRLMRAAHPDAGGSDWLAARLNEARDTLLRD